MYSVDLQNKKTKTTFKKRLKKMRWGGGGVGEMVQLTTVFNSGSRGSDLLTQTYRQAKH